MKSEDEDRLIITKLNPHNQTPVIPKEESSNPGVGKMLKLHNLLADNGLQYLYPLIERKSISVEGLVKLSKDYDFILVMKKVCKMKQRDAVKLMSVIVKYISVEYAAGRKIEEDNEVVKLMDNRSKK